MHQLTDAVVAALAELPIERCAERLVSLPVLRQVEHGGEGHGARQLPPRLDAAHGQPAAHANMVPAA